MIPPVTLKSKNARTAVEIVWNDLRRQIIDGGLYPPGSKLRVEHLKSIYGLSGSTIREALTRLISDHLVTWEEQKGFRVAQMSLADLKDLTYVRIVLECAALRESIDRGDDDWEANVVTAFHRLTRADERLREDPEAYFETWECRNKEFHVALIAGAHSPWLQRFHTAVLQQSARYRRITSRIPASRESVHQEHEAIFDAAIAHDAPRAESVLRSHIQRAIDLLEASGDPEAKIASLTQRNLAPDKPEQKRTTPKQPLATPPAGSADAVETPENLPGDKF
jgi:DNA-binding GntR family transcriptional regulator